MNSEADIDGANLVVEKPDAAGYIPKVSFSGNHHAGPQCLTLRDAQNEAIRMAEKLLGQAIDPLQIKWSSELPTGIRHIEL
jgi:hypothetical protein